jgi:hypothetical protein
MFKNYSLKEIFENISDMPNSWLYLPDSVWTLDTHGSFSLNSFDYPPNSRDYLPPQVESEGWKETFETCMIEDVVLNVNEQLSRPTARDYLQAFIFFYENDAFIEF